MFPSVRPCTMDTMTNITLQPIGLLSGPKYLVWVAYKFILFIGLQMGRLEKNSQGRSMIKLLDDRTYYAPSVFTD